MRLALCVHFLDGDIWKERLRAADEGIAVIDEYGSAKELLDSVNVHDVVIVALRGVAGLQAVRTLREAKYMQPLVWIADEEEYALFSYRYRVAFFLLDTEEPAVLRSALRRAREEGACLQE